jgi:hypothetical protein
MRGTSNRGGAAECAEEELDALLATLQRGDLTPPEVSAGVVAIADRPVALVRVSVRDAPG